MRAIKFNPDSPYTLGGMTIFLNKRFAVDGKVYYRTNRTIRGKEFICSRDLLKKTLDMAVTRGCGGYKYKCV